MKFRRVLMNRWVLGITAIVLLLYFAETRWSSAQRGKYVVSGSAGTPQPKGSGKIITVFGNVRIPSYRQSMPRQEWLRFDIHTDFSALKTTGGGGGGEDSHDTYVSTFRTFWSGNWKDSGKPFEMELIVRWDRETDIVEIGRLSFDRSKSHEFVIQVIAADQTISAIQLDAGNADAAPN